MPPDLQQRAEMRPPAEARHELAPMFVAGGGSLPPASRHPVEAATLAKWFCIHSDGPPASVGACPLSAGHTDAEYRAAIAPFLLANCDQPEQRAAMRGRPGAFNNNSGTVVFCMQFGPIAARRRREASCFPERDAGVENVPSRRRTSRMCHSRHGTAAPQGIFGRPTVLPARRSSARG